MKTMANSVTVSIVALFMGACGYNPEYEKVQRPPLYQGLVAQQLDDKQGTVKSAFIYEPYHTLAEVPVGSIRACFTQMVDAASVNTGSYRVDCVGPAGNIVARFATESEESESWKTPLLPGSNKRHIQTLQMKFTSERLP